MEDSSRKGFSVIIGLLDLNWNFDCSKVTATTAQQGEQQPGAGKEGASWLGRMFTADKAGEQAERNPNLECDIQKSGFRPHQTDFNRPSVEEVAQMKAAASAGGAAGERRRIRWPFLVLIIT